MSRILTISGSLRQASSNTILLQAMARLAPSGMQVEAYEDLGNLPHFNPDLDGEQSPAPVLALRKKIAEVDGIIISSPEYAHGVPGTLKNALDWLVSTMEIVDKPLVLINASTSAGEYALGQLLEILRTINTRVVASHALQGIQVRRGISAAGAITDPHLQSLVRACFQALTEAIVCSPSKPSSP